MKRVPRLNRILVICLTVILTVIFIGSALYLGYYLKIADICATVRKYSKEYDVDYSLILGIISTESGFDRYAVSKRGAKGLMQIMPSTAKEMAEKLKLVDYEEGMLTISDTNIKLGVYYLNILLNYYDNTDWAIVAYNAGIGNVDKWKEQGLTLNEVPFDESKAYLSKVNKNAKVFGFLY